MLGIADIHIPAISRNSHSCQKGNNGYNAFDNAVHYYYYYKNGVRCARPGESENTLSVRRPQPHTTNPLKEGKDKIVGDKKERADHANRKALAQIGRAHV